MTLKSYIVCERADCFGYGEHMSCYSTKTESIKCRFFETANEVRGKIENPLEHLITQEQINKARAWGEM
jgi:hypothetical protein